MTPVPGSVMGDFEDQESPQLIGLTQVQSVRCGHRHTTAIRWDGSLYQWGEVSVGRCWTVPTMCQMVS